MASFGLYEVTFQNICKARMPLSDKLVTDAVEEHDLYAQNYLSCKFSLRVLVCGLELDPDTIDICKDIVFNRIRRARYGDHFRERVERLAGYDDEDPEPSS